MSFTPLHGLAFAWRGLTALPLPGPPCGSARQGVYWFALVGAALGSLLVGAGELALHWLPPQAAAALLVALWAMLTGCLHLDGLADSLDGLLPLKTPAERLLIMKDPHPGAFGVVGLVLQLLLKWQFLSLLLAQGSPWLLVPLLAAARAGAVWLAWRAPYARPSGTGQGVVEAAQPQSALVNLGVSLGLALWLGVGGLAVLPVVLAEGLRAWCIRRLGGVTGDVLGFQIELTETLGLVLLALGEVA